MKRAIGVMMLFALGACGVESAAGGDTDHVLTVNGGQYNSYQESGDSIHWLTPGGDVESASFAERDQTWDGNGSDNLPCDGEIHWVSTPNVLTISDCKTTTTTTSTTSTTTTSTSTTTTKPPCVDCTPNTQVVIPTTTTTTTTVAVIPPPVPTTTTTTTTVAPTPVARTIPETE